LRFAAHLLVGSAPTPSRGPKKLGKKASRPANPQMFTDIPQSQPIPSQQGILGAPKFKTINSSYAIGTNCSLSVA